jgi:hypothetical protein
MNENDYTEIQLKRFKYYLPELEAKFKENPKSLTLRNGIAHIRKTLGLPETVAAIDPLTYLAHLEEQSGL